MQPNGYMRDAIPKRALHMNNFDKVLLKPNIEPLDSNTQRIRRNLIVSSVVLLFVYLGSSGIDAGNSSFAGIKFTEINPKTIFWFFLLSEIYFLGHFIWASIDHLKENCLRLTGIAIPMVTGVSRLASEHTLEPNVDDPRQTSIYSWWAYKIRIKDQTDEILDNLRTNVTEEKHTQAITTISKTVEKLQHESAYILEALKRYERGFWHHQTSQLLRWLALDFLVPTLLGVVSVFVLFCNY